MEDTINFKEVLEEYFAYRDACGKKEYPKKYIRLFYTRSCEMFPGEETLTQSMIYEWWKKRPTENESSHYNRICSVLPLLKFVADRYKPKSLFILPLPKWVPRNYRPHYFTEEELGSFFNACDNIKIKYNTLENKLNKIELPVLFRLLMSAGIRTTEGRLLSARNIDLERGIIHIKEKETKGYVEHTVVLHDSMRDLLVRYDHAVEKLMPERKIFFPNDKDKSHPNNWLSHHFRKLWRESNDDDGVVVPYDLRHYFIIENINSWTNCGYEIHDKMVALSKYVGHSNLSATYGYYEYVPRLGKTIEEFTGDFYNELVPEIPDLSEDEET